MNPLPRKRILIVDDSAVMRSFLRRVLALDERLEIVGTASDGGSGVAAACTLRPDLIVLDVEMPVLDGLGTLRELRTRGVRTPVIMCSSLTHFGASVTIEALAYGAADYVTKPVGQSDSEAAVRTLSRELLPKIHALLLPQNNSAPARPERTAESGEKSRASRSATRPAILVIGVSTGGPAALSSVLPCLPADFAIPVLVVQHMPQLFTRLLADRLNSLCSLSVQEAAEGGQVKPGSIWIAKGDYHLEIGAGPGQLSPPTLHLSRGPLENHCRPAADVLFRSAAAHYGSGTIAIVLTGMGSDGLSGAQTVRKVGGFVIAQDEASSTVWGMPGAVARAGIADRVLPLKSIGTELLSLIRQRAIADGREVQVA